MTFVRSVWWYFSVFLIFVLFFFAFFGGIVRVLGVGGFDQVRVALVSYLAVSVVLSVLFFNWRSSRSPSAILFLLGTLLFVLSSLISDHLYAVSKFWLANLSYFLFALLFVFVFFSSQSPQFRITLAQVVICAVFVFSLVYLSLYVALLVAGGMQSFRGAIIGSGFANINFLGQVATWCIPLLSAAASYEYRYRRQLIRILSFSLMSGLWFIVLSVSIRGTILSIALSSVFLFLVFGGRSRNHVYPALLSFVLAFLLWVAVTQFVIDSKDLISNEFVVDPTGRVMLWREAWGMSFVNFPWGMGGESWILHAPVDGNFISNLSHGHPHNTYFLFAAEYGWVSLLGLALVFLAFALRIRYFKMTVKLSSKADSAKVMLTLGFIYSCVSGLLHAGVSGNLLMPSSAIVGVTCLSSLWALLEAESSGFIVSNNQVRGSNVLVPICMVLMLSTWAILWSRGVYDYWESMKLDGGRYSEGGVTYYPRFWLHGYAADLPASYQSVH